MHSGVVLSLYLPATHAVHAVVHEMHGRVPDLHVELELHDTHDDAPAEEPVPMGQVWHAEEPWKYAYFPAGHEIHADDPDELK
jgi:hypothetical protein